MKRTGFRVLITGQMGKISRDVATHLVNDRGYVTAQCPPKKSELLKMSLEMMPQIVVICLNDEDSNSIKVFDILTEAEKVGEIAFFVVAREEDMAEFTKYTALKRATLLLRPLSLPAMYNKLDEIEERWREKENKIALAAKEFVNPNEPVAFSRRHILVVDDDPEQLFQIRDHLREFYEVTLVGSGKNVPKYLSRFHVDLILLDYMMPEMDGPAVLKELRSHQEYIDIPVIFLTGVAEKKTILKTISELKPQGYIVKPVKKSKLVASIIDVLG